ncbi:MAG: hypothetical protein HY776_06040 [Actinobacteria bacterium]|nr:hypothetical protein [Actinomycetota bacterium]
MSDSVRTKSRRERKKSSKGFFDKLIDFILSRWLRYLFIIGVILIGFMFLGEYLFLQKNSKVVIPNEPINKSAAFDNLVFSVGILKTRFKSKEPISILLKVKNEGSSKKALFFTSSQKFDVSVLNSAKAEIWRWSKDKLFTMAIEEIPLNPQDETFFEVKWKQNDFNGQIVPPGTYYIVSKCVSSEWQPVIEVQIEIEPEKNVKRKT